MRAVVPASSANLGPGFDVLAVALALYTEVRIVPSPRLVVQTEGQGSALPADATHLAVRVATSVLGHADFELHVRSEIPVARGLGSSAALAVAAAAAAGSPDPLGVATSFEGHAENAAASVMGGLIAAALVKGQPVARALVLDPRLRMVALIPDHELRTPAARAVLPETVAFSDAVFDLGRLGLLVAGLADASAMTPAATEDRLHQDARSALFPEAPILLERLRSAGAIGACWSGAGPTLLGLCDVDSAETVREAGARALAEAGVPGRSVEVNPDRHGLRIFPD